MHLKNLKTRVKCTEMHHFQWKIQNFWGGGRDTPPQTPPLHSLCVPPLLFYNLRPGDRWVYPAWNIYFIKSVVWWTQLITKQLRLWQRVLAYIGSEAKMSTTQLSGTCKFHSFTNTTPDRQYLVFSKYLRKQLVMRWQRSKQFLHAVTGSDSFWC